MFRYSIERTTLLIACSFVWCLTLFSQTISYETPDEFFVCGSAPFEITITNSTGMALQGVTVAVNFTTNDGQDCGMAYLPNTVSGASEANISDLGNPVFSIADMSPGAVAILTVQVEAPCSVMDCIDGAAFFVNEISLNWSGGTTSITTNPYVVERALLVITQVKNGYMTGSQGDLLFREITIVNTRPGALQGFLFTDMHQGGMTISSAQGTVVPAGVNTFQIALDGSDFAAIGDGDDLFELNESITITEFVRIADCGVEVPSTVSQITAEWGCGGDVCQEVSKIAIIDITPSEKLPNLIWEPITSVPGSFCGPEAFQQGMKITNVGTGAAVDLVFDFRRLGPVTVWIDTSSVLVDSAGTLLDIQPGFGFISTLMPPCTGTDGGVAGTFQLTIPRIGASQSVIIYWDLYACDAVCSQPEINWQYRWSYFKECPPSPFVAMNNFINVTATAPQIVSTAALPDANILMDDSVYTIEYSLSYDSLSLLDDELVIQIELPCGLRWETVNELLLDGQAPLSVVLEADTLSTIITATYQLPLNANMAMLTYNVAFHCEDLCDGEDVCKDTLISSCELLPCIPPSPPMLEVGHFTTLNQNEGVPLGCNMTACTSILIPYQCDIDSLCINEPPGYVVFDFEAARDNYGLPDNNNDRLPDGTGPVDLSLVATHRLIAGDVIRTRMAGEVIMDEVGATLPFGHVNLSFFVNESTIVNAPNFTQDGTGISEGEIMIRIFDRSTGNYYDCNDPMADVISANVLRYQYGISASALVGCLPAGFEYAAGDSIIFTGTYRLVYKMVPENDITPMTAQLGVQPEIFVFDENTEMYNPISCACQTDHFEVSAYTYTLLPGIFGLNPCGPSEYIGGSLFRLDLAAGNFFPYEYRNLIFAEDWQLSMPPEITLCESRMTFLRYQGGNTLLNNQPLDFNFTNNNYVIDIGQYQLPPMDEGFSFLLQYIYKMDCNVIGSRPLTIRTHLDFLDSMPENNDPLDFTINANALQAMIPQLSLQALNQDIISFNDQLKLELFLENKPTLVAGQSSAAAPNTWLYLTSQTGLVTDLVLVNPNSGMPFPSVNGVYQLGDFPVGTDTLLLCGTNNSCEVETVTIHYGWNCDPFTSQVQTACYRRILPITIESPPGEIDFLVESPSGCFDLCETIPPYSLQIFNGDLGAVYGLVAEAQFPLGQTVVPGSSQVEYPTGSGQFFTINDPVFVNITLTQWDLSVFDSLVNGLPGVGFAPANSITLLFETITECGFIADAFPLFTIAAELNCGQPSNTVAKPGDPVCINGVTQPYTTNIQVETSSPFGCADEMVFEFSMTASQTLPAGACVVVTLPQGIALVPNSCTSICQNTFNCTPAVEGNNYTWQLPQGVAANEIVCFTFNTIGWSSFGCEEGLIIFRTANETQALCAATGDMCSSKVSTGSLLFPFDIKRPAFELDNFTISASQTSGNDLVDFSIDITNCGPQNEPPITVDFYLDTNNDGTGDQLVHSQNMLTILANCQTATMTGNFNLPPGNLCNLVAYINADQCACSLDSAYVFSPITYQTDQSFTVCSGENRTIGVPSMPGFTYQWEPADCLGNGNDANTVFNCENNTPVPVTYQFALAETDGTACEINHLLDVTVQPVPGIAFAETPICAGEQANLAATDGVTFNWQGPGISNPSLQIQTIAPPTTSTYAVTVMDAFSCMGTDMVTVEVNAHPVVDAGDDIFTCPGVVPQLDATFDPDWDYLWSPAIIGGLPSLSNPAVHNPTVISTQDATFSLTVTDENGCTASDAVNVSLSGALDLIISPDATICTGTTITLTVSGGDMYVWSPPGNCLNPACSAISVTPLVPTTYTVVASTSDGCLDSAKVTVTPTMDDIMTFDTVRICAGESAIVHGEAVNTPGDYVKLFNLPAGCDSISTVTLLVGDPAILVAVDAIFCESGVFEFNGVVYEEPGSYMDTVLAANGCDSILYSIIVVEIAPQVEIQGPSSIAPGDTITLQIEPTTYDSIVWSGGGMGPACDNADTCDDVPSETLVYIATVVDENGCTAIDTHLVNVIVQCFPDKAQIPNVFTPNSDGKNDTFSIVSKNSEVVLKMRVWDRWGNLVYEGTGPWDGTYKGKPAGSDVYIYDIVVGCPVGVDADEKQLRGDVTLLR